MIDISKPPFTDYAQDHDMFADSEAEDHSMPPLITLASTPHAAGVEVVPITPRTPVIIDLLDTDSLRDPDDEDLDELLFGGRSGTPPCKRTRICRKGPDIFATPPKVAAIGSIGDAEIDEMLSAGTRAPSAAEY